MNRYSRSHQIEQLDPKTEHSQICRLLVGDEFPWGISRSLELAMIKTFCVPSISRLLDQTGGFHRHGQKRYDDTAILIGKILKVIKSKILVPFLYFPSLIKLLANN